MTKQNKTKQNNTVMDGAYDNCLENIQYIFDDYRNEINKNKRAINRLMKSIDATLKTININDFILNSFSNTSFDLRTAHAVIRFSNAGNCITLSNLHTCKNQRFEINQIYDLFNQFITLNK